LWIAENLDGICPAANPARLRRGEIGRRIILVLTVSGIGRTVTMNESGI
jgi:hypothetical protein